VRIAGDATTALAASAGMLDVALQQGPTQDFGGVGESTEVLLPGADSAIMRHLNVLRVQINSLFNLLFSCFAVWLFGWPSANYHGSGEQGSVVRIHAPF